MRVYLHYGDTGHTPMQTVLFTGTSRELRALIKEARAEGWPMRVQRVTS